MRSLIFKRTAAGAAAIGAMAVILTVAVRVDAAPPATTGTPAVAAPAGTLPTVTPSTAAQSLPPLQEGMEERPAARLRMLDKVTARTSTVVVKVGAVTQFRGLTVTVRACRENPPTLAPESAAFLEIDEQTPDGARQRAFSGWMFASSPALSAMDSPVYDVWVLGCPTG